jgi:hypothetical protein
MPAFLFVSTIRLAYRLITIQHDRGGAAKPFLGDRHASLGVRMV